MKRQLFSILFLFIAVLAILRFNGIGTKELLQPDEADFDTEYCSLESYERSVLLEPNIEIALLSPNNPVCYALYNSHDQYFQFITLDKTKTGSYRLKDISVKIGFSSDSSSTITEGTFDSCRANFVFSPYEIDNFGLYEGYEKIAFSSAYLLYWIDI